MLLAEGEHGSILTGKNDWTMNEPELQALIDAATTYEELMVPALFRQWSSKVADAAGIQPGQRVLDVACGTGVLSREAAARTGPQGAVTGLDPGPGMLEVARRAAPAVEWRQGVAESLPFPDNSFDVVVSQFGLMFFSDRREAIHQALRVLVPGGSLAFAVWDSLDKIPAYADEVALVEALAGEAAADAIRFPFRLGNEQDLVALFSEAGVTSVQCTTARERANFPSVRVMVEADLRGWLPIMGINLPEEKITSILEKAEDELQSYTTAEGKASFHCSAHIVTGKKPHA